MPELPEVEVTRRRIEPFLVGRKLAGVRTTAPSYFFLTPPHRLARQLAGRTVSQLVRRGKYLVADPISEVGMLTVSRAQLKSFIKYWGGTGNALCSAR